MVHLLGVFRLLPPREFCSKYSCLVWQFVNDIFKWQQCSGLDFEQHIHIDKSHIQTKTKLRWHNKKHVNMMNKCRKNTRLGKHSSIPLKTILKQNRTKRIDWWNQWHFKHLLCSVSTSISISTIFFYRRRIFLLATYSLWIRVWEQYVDGESNDWMATMWIAI